ncbi:protein trichome birefringence-like 19 [Magnolia sinica]|uniref:protein trichome birefringence-like 19 n=1 Tax=Magnolia sinica TaxID=86752 RepID=UPI002659CA3E|nr:protein trichome birefringence-like 19 [Magnolia sinica]
MSSPLSSSVSSPSVSPPPPPPLPSSSSSSSNDVNNSTVAITRSDKKCDIFKGEWVPNPDAPYYTNTTCGFIPDQQNCMKFGRPDTAFLKWRWKPNGCDLPIFNPAHFLDLVRGKSMAFVGDSVGRNQMQSLICLLSRVDHPIDISNTTDDRFKTWLYANYNFTLASFWSPFLVKTKEPDPNNNHPVGLLNLYLDEFDEKWTAQIDRFNYVIISAGHWFFRPVMFYEGGHVVGCSICQHKNITDLTTYYGSRKAFQTAFRAINGHDRFNGTTFLRTFSPAHFENGPWNRGGYCMRTRPFRSNESRQEWFYRELYKTQVEEFRIAKEEGRKRDVRFRLLDSTEAMSMRPDGHPNRYGHSQHVRVGNDCVHWCLPGPIDTWNDMLLEMMRMDGGRSSDEKYSSRELRTR